MLSVRDKHRLNIIQSNETLRHLHSDLFFNENTFNLLLQLTKNKSNTKKFLKTSIQYHTLFLQENYKYLKTIKEDMDVENIRWLITVASEHTLCHIKYSLYNKKFNIDDLSDSEFETLHSDLIEFITNKCPLIYPLQ
jgi:hypothetical protein